MKYAKTLKENLQLLKEGPIYTVIRTKNGKVDYIEKVEQLADGTYMKKAGTSFDRAFIGMDPQEAKNALVKYSHFDPKLIMIDEGCGKIKEAAPAVKVGSKIRVKNGATSWEAEVVKVNDNGTPAILKSIRTKSPDFGKEYKGSWDEYEVIEESIRTAPKIDMSSQEAWDKSNAEIEKWKKELDSKADDIQKKMARMAGRCYYDMTVKMNPSEAEKCFNEFEKIYNDLDSLLSKYRIAKN